MSAAKGGLTQIPAFCTPVIRRDLHRPSLCYLDVTFLDGSDSQLVLDALVFQNYYTASVSINMQTSPTTFIPILENKVIMANPYSEEGAQSSVTIFASEFHDNYERGKSLRITLAQPATMWSTFEIRNLVAIGRPASQSSQHSSPLTSKPTISPRGGFSAPGALIGVAESNMVGGVFKSLKAVTMMDLATLEGIVSNFESRKALEQQNSSTAETTKGSRRRVPKVKRNQPAPRPSSLET